MQNVISAGSENSWYELDPDYRKNPPKAGLYCCRCMQPLKEAAGTAFIAVETREIEPGSVCLVVRKNPLGKELIGEDCWKRIAA